MNVLIIDGYIDEPACLGVPPFISPYPRYIAGAFVSKGIKPENIFYRTIDQIRINNIKENFDLVIIIAGTTVPGKYLRAKPISLRELKDLSNNYEKTIIGGPIKLGFSDQGGKSATELSDLFITKGDIEAFVYDMMTDLKSDLESISHRKRTNKEIAEWSKKGSFIIKQHPDYPYLVCEIETYRGCTRDSYCSFCTESFYGSPDFRDIKDVVNEVSALYSQGARYFRIGRQPDLFMYNSKNGKPVPEAIEKLYIGIRNVAPKLKVLHFDNVSPSTISKFPEESRKIAKIIVKYHTSGDVAALGMESADPNVINANNLKASPEQVFDAIKLLNDIGSFRGKNGLPELLPGINFVYGLKNETKKTFELNFKFLKNVLESGLLLRRVNMRQVMAFSGTEIYGNEKIIKKHKKLFLYYKEKTRKEIDYQMLKRILPIGTVLKDVRTEVFDKITYGRQLGSYPILVGIPEKLELNKFYDIMVTQHGRRSITGVRVI